MNLGRNPDSPFGDILTISQNSPVFTADFYAVDGISQKVAAFLDWQDFTHLLAQSLGASQVAIPVAQADFGNRLCATFISAYYVSNRASSAWKYTVDGTGCEIVHVLALTSLAGTQIISASTRNNTATTGNSCYFSSGQPRLLVRSGVTTVASASPGVTLTINAPTYTSTAFIGATNPGYALYLKSALLASGLLSAAPAVGLPDKTMVLGGADPNISAFPLLARWAGSLFSRNIFGVGAERVTLQSGIQQLWGITP